MSIEKIKDGLERYKARADMWQRLLQRFYVEYESLQESGKFHLELKDNYFRVSVGHPQAALITVFNDGHQLRFVFTKNGIFSEDGYVVQYVTDFGVGCKIFVETITGFLTHNRIFSL